MLHGLKSSHKNKNKGSPDMGQNRPKMGEEGTASSTLKMWTASRASKWTSALAIGSGTTNSELKRRQKKKKKTHPPMAEATTEYYNSGNHKDVRVQYFESGAGRGRVLDQSIGYGYRCKYRSRNKHHHAYWQGQKEQQSFLTQECHILIQIDNLWHMLIIQICS